MSESAISTRSDFAARAADLWSMTKPRIGLMALIVTAIGFSLGTPESWWVLAPALVGVGLLAAASSILNQVVEARVDARMTRTSGRPIPAGRISRSEAAVFGLLCTVIGVAVLWAFTNVLTTVLAVGTLVCYVAVYTPLKQRSAWCTTIGAIPGAMPPVLGFTAATGLLTIEAAMLFGVLFLWQFPHFLAIAWIHREDYDNAGLKMLPRSKHLPELPGWISAMTAFALLVLTAGSIFLGIAGWLFAGVAAVLGTVYLWRAFQFLRNQSTQTARRVLFTSLAYLPLVLLALLLDASLLG